MFPPNLHCNALSSNSQGYTCSPVFVALFLCFPAKFPQQTIQHDRDRPVGDLPGCLPPAAHRGHAKPTNPWVLSSGAGSPSVHQGGISLRAGAARCDISASGMQRRADHPLCMQQLLKRVAVGTGISKSWDVQLSR